MIIGQQGSGTFGRYDDLGRVLSKDRQRNGRYHEIGGMTFQIRLWQGQNVAFCFYHIVSSSGTVVPSVGGVIIPKNRRRHAAVLRLVVVVFVVGNSHATSIDDSSAGIYSSRGVLSSAKLATVSSVRTIS